MLFKLDENTPWILKKIIENEGDHQVDSVFHQKIKGIPDKDLIAHCFKEGRILITLDHDFMNPILYPNDIHKGIVILCPVTQGKAAVLYLFKRFLKKFSLDEIKRRVVIISPTEIKIRE